MDPRPRTMRSATSEPSATGMSWLSSSSATRNRCGRSGIGKPFSISHLGGLSGRTETSENCPGRICTSPPTRLPTFTCASIPTLMVAASSGETNATTSGCPGACDRTRPTGSPADTTLPGERSRVTTSPAFGLMIAVSNVDSASRLAATRTCSNSPWLASVNCPRSSKTSMTPAITGSQCCVVAGVLRLAMGCPDVTESPSDAGTSSTTPESGLIRWYRSPGRTSAAS